MSDIARQLSENIKDAYDEGKALNIVGGDTKHFLGRTAKGETLNVTEHSGIVTYNPTELVMTARSGTTLQEITDTLADNGQICSFEPALFDGKATLGGTLACNLSGPARPWLGSIRDSVLGTRLINGKGEYLRFGGQVMKNVAGYDVSRLQAGAYGSLGLITEVSFKVLPKPSKSITVSLELDAKEAISLMNTLAGQSLPLTGSTWENGVLTLRLEGSSRAVDAANNKLGGSVVDDDVAFWQGLNEQTLSFFQSKQPLWRFSLNSNAAHFYEDQQWIIDWGGAQRWLVGEFDKAELEAKASNAKGHVTLFRHGDRDGDVFQSQSSIHQTMHKNLKAAFDPKHILNPGRMYSWL